MLIHRSIRRLKTISYVDRKRPHAKSSQSGQSLPQIETQALTTTDVISSSSASTLQRAMHASCGRIQRPVQNELAGLDNRLSFSSISSKFKKRTELMFYGYRYRSSNPPPLSLQNPILDQVRWPRSLPCSIVFPASNSFTFSKLNSHQPGALVQGY
jgi:hypothetical protein